MTPRCLRRRALARALVGGGLAIGASTLWIITDAGDDALVLNRWESGFLRRSAGGELVEWTPPAGAERIAGGYTDWTPELRFAGEPLPSDIVARWWCEYAYERIPVGRLAPLVERCAIEVTITDTNYAPFGPGAADELAPAALGALEARRADPAHAGRDDLVAALRVVKPEHGVAAGARIYWRGLPRQVALLACALIGASLLVASIRPALRARRLTRLRVDRACPRCLYDAGASPDRCPECGQALEPDQPASHGKRSL